MGSCHQFVQDGACPTRLGTEMRRLPVRGSCRDLWAFLESLHHFSQSSWKEQSIWSCCSGPTWGLPGILAGWPRWRLCFWERGAQEEAGPSLTPAQLPPEALPGQDGASPMWRTDPWLPERGVQTAGCQTGPRTCPTTRKRASIL